MKQLSALLFVCALLVFGSTETQAQCNAASGWTNALTGWNAPIYPPIRSTPPWAALNPPTSSGGVISAACTSAGYRQNCIDCPAAWSTTLTGTQNRALMYMCSGNQYTITTCGSPTASSTITVTTTTNVVQEFDANSCGTHATVNFSPQTSGIFFININASFTGCTQAIAGTLLQISCGAGACPDSGDDPCASTPPPSCNPNFTPCPAVAGATPFPALTPTCTTLGGTTAGATATTGVGSGTPSCGGYPNNGDVWFTATSSGTGTLALDLDHVSATNLAMAIYSTSGGCTPANLTEVLCNADLIPGVDNSPFISTSSLTPNTLYYIRVWPQNNTANGGTFTLCAYFPVPPSNDNPCVPAVLTMNPGCVPVTFNTQDATNSIVPGPGCSSGNNDVWFRVTMPSAGTLNVNSLPGTLTDMAMAVYTGTCGALVLAQCQTGGTGMPNMTPTAYAAGQQLYIRMWSETNGFGTFQICAYLSQPPANDNPCGAYPIQTRYGCLMTATTTGLALQTATNQGGATIPNPLCGGTPNNDVWYTTVVPANGQILINTDDAQMNDAAAAVYTATNGCNSGSTFTQVGCWVGGSSNLATMPSGTVTGLTPGATVYIRLWRQSGATGTGYLCSSRTDTPPVIPGSACYYTLNMNDTGGDGWNGSFVTITVGGVPTNYTIVSGNGNITFPINNGQTYIITYTAVGGFQNQISYSVVSNLGALIYSSTPIPTAGLNAAGSADCNLPPANPADCLGAFRICSATSTLAGSPGNAGAVADLNAGNDGCMAGEHEGLWYTFSAGNPGTMSFTITPGGYADYDFAVWGPYSSAPSCPTGPLGTPLRCSWAAGGGPTGLNSTEFDLTEGAGGNRFVRELTGVTTGQYFILYVDNWSRNGINFGMSFGGTASPSCTILPFDMLAFDGRPIEHQVELDWSTSTEINSSHFIVERSTDNINFEAIGRVNAAGNTNSRSDYMFLDPAPYDGFNYYRLQHVGREGQATQTHVVPVVFRKTSSLFVYPNPATESLTASFGASSEGTVRWRILDMSGRQVGEGSLSNNEGISRFNVPVSALESGSYMLEVLEGKGTPIGNARFVKQ